MVCQRAEKGRAPGAERSQGGDVKNSQPIDDDATRKRKGICPQCLHFVGRGKLLNIGDRWMCGACGQRAIDEWNALVRAADATAAP